MTMRRLNRRITVQSGKYMAKIENVCKVCRRYQTKLFLKGERCNSPKCAVTKRNYRPGIHGQNVWSDA